MEKSRRLYNTSLGLEIGLKASDFLKGLEIPYLSIFLSAQSDNIKSV